MASVVSIKVVIDGTEDSVQRIDQLDAAMKNLGLNGTVNIRKLGEGLDQVGGHAQTNLDKVRLLSQEFGLRLPRALESTLSHMPQFMSALAGIGGAITGFAFGEVFVRLGDEIYNAEQKYISITAEADKFYETLEKTSKLDFTNTRDIATTEMRLNQARHSMITGPQLATAAQADARLKLMEGDIGGAVGTFAESHFEAGVGAEGMQWFVEMSKKKLDQQHEEVLAQINLNHALDGELQKRDQIIAAREKTKAITAENRSYDRKVEMNYGNPAPDGAGAEEQRMKDAQADAEANAKLSDYALQQQQAIIKARGEAAEAGLQGESLYQQKLKDTLADLHAELAAQRDLGQYEARAAAVRAQYDADRLARLRTLNEETQRMKDETAQAGLSGAARIIAERDAQIAAINEKQQKFSGGAALDPAARADFDQQRASAASASYAKITALGQEFTTRAEALAQERADAELGAFGRIDAGAARSVAELKKTYDQDFAALSDSDQQKIDATRAYNDAVAAINANAAQQKAELAARNRAEDLQYDREAQQAESRVRSQGITGWIGQHQQAVLAIQDQEAQRIAKLQEDAAKEGLTWQEVAQRRADIERQATAEIAETNEQLAHQIAGTLQSAFTDPMRFIKEQGEKMMFEMIARWLMQLGLFKNAYGAIMGGLGPNGASSGIGGAAARVLFGGGGANAGGGYGIGAIARGDGSGSYRPSGTTGVMGGGLTLPSDYNSTSSAAPQLINRDPLAVGGGTASPAAQISSTISGTTQLASMLGLGRVQAQAAGIVPASPGAGGAASRSSSTAMQSIGGAPSVTTAMSGVMGIAGSAAAGYAGAEGVLDAFHTGGAKGALQGASSGAALGAAVGSIVPGIGTVIGGIAGAAAGLATNIVGDVLGESGKFGARDYYKNTLFPEMEKLRNNNATDYLSAVSEARRDASDGLNYMTQKWGQGAASWVNANYLTKELNDVVTSITSRAASGAQYIGRSAKEFHSGGMISDFGDLGTTSTEGYIHAMLGEGIVNQPAMATHGAGVGLMNRGASPADMASHYLSMMPGGGSMASGGGDTHHHWDVSAVDAKSFADMLDGGGAAVINRSLNKFTGTYAGDGVPA